VIAPQGTRQNSDRNFGIRSANATLSSLLYIKDLENLQKKISGQAKRDPEKSSKEDLGASKKRQPRRAG